jgi:AcrR family transcriptional regulator
MTDPNAKADTPDRVERRKAETRQHLLAAARRIFVRVGYHDTRPQDIAREADVGYGTFYLHFADKRECFVACMADARAELDAWIRERWTAAHAAGTRGVAPFLTTVLNAILDYAEANPGVLRAAMTDFPLVMPEHQERTPLIDAWAQGWGRLIAAGAREGVFYADADPDVIGHAVVGLIRGASLADAPRSQRVDTMVRLLVRALVPEPDGTAAQQFEPREEKLP